MAAMFFLLMPFLLASCSSGFSVRTDEDPRADFSRYATWDFFNPMGIEGGYNSPIYGEHFRDAISREMRQRGYRKAENPDLYINVSFRADDQVKMSTYTRPYMSGAYYGNPVSGASYGSALGVGVGVGSAPKKTTEVSVFIDMVDNNSDRMVWQGVAVFEASEKVATRLRDATHTAVNNVFAKYPHTAGR